jgi:6-phosphogluconolactonase/glucosamine-6-phosphate isomerase/deaminase
MEIITSAVPEETASHLLSDTLRRYQNKSVLLMLSGGSALTLLDQVDFSVLGHHVTITTLDERFSIDPTINNFAQLQATNFFNESIIRGVSIIDTSIIPSDTMNGVKERCENALCDWMAKFPNGIVLTVMGIGSDGHTAGIFPGEYEVDFFGSSWVVAYTVPKEINQFQQRLTVTHTFLREQVNEAIVYAVGMDKKPVIEMIKQIDCATRDLPSGILKEMARVTLVTDLDNSKGTNV